MNTHGVSLSASNLRAIQAGRPFQLRHEQLMAGGPHRLHLKANKTRRVHRAMHKGVGLRLHLDGDEMRGSGFRETVSRAYQAIRPHIRPVLHKLADRAVPYLEQGIRQGITPYLGQEAASHLSQAASPGLHAGINAVGDMTGAYGLSSSRGRARALSSQSEGRGLPKWAKPVVRKGLKAVGSAAAMYLAPELAPITIPLVQRGIDELGNRTGGFGVAAKRKRGRPRKVALAHSGRKVSVQPKVGGSFIPAGY